MLIERTATGGQAGQSSRIENYLGFPDGLSGAQLAERARRQAEKFDAELITAAEVSALEIDGNARTVHLSDGRSIGTRAVILAMGVEYRQLAAEGCADLTGAGVLLRRDHRWPPSAMTTRSTSSAAPTRRARPRCSCPAPRSR